MVAYQVTKIRPKQPYKICKKCYLGLHNWLNKRSPSMSFAVPMIWGEPKDYSENCNFCLTKTKGFFFKQKDDLDSTSIPVPYAESMPRSMPPQDRLDANDCSAN